MILRDLAEEGGKIQRTGLRYYVKQAVPYVSTVALIAYLVFKLKDEVTLGQIKTSFEEANMLLFLVGVSIPLIIGYLGEVVMSSLLFTWFIKPLKMRDIWAVKGASYILMILHHGVGQAAWAIYLMKKMKITFKETASMIMPGAIVFSFLIPAIVTMILVISSLGLYEIEARFYIPVILTFIIGWLIFLFNLTYWIFGWKWGKLDRFHEWPFFHALVKATYPQWLVIFIFGISTMLLAFGGHYICARAFGLDMDYHIFIARFLLVIPYIMLIPSVGHVGPLTAGWLYVYADVMSTDDIVTCTVLIIVGHHIVRAVIGLICMYPANKEVKKVLAATKNEDEPEKTHASEMLPEEPIVREPEKPVEGVLPEADA